MKDIERQIKDAATNGNLEKLKKSISSLSMAMGTQSLEVLDSVSNGGSALMLAAANGHVDCVEFLIGLGANINLKKWTGHTALMLAAENGHAACIKYLIDNDTIIDIANGFSENALMLAAANGHVDCVKVLIGLGANIDFTYKEGCSALMLAAMNGHAACVECLIKNDAKIDITESNGENALMLASKSNHLDCVTAILKAICDTTAKNAVSFSRLIQNQQIWARINAQNRYGETALTIAANSGHLDIVEFLIENGAIKEIENMQGDTPLIQAATRNHCNIVQYIVEQGAQLDRRNDKGKSALTQAATLGYFEIVKCLVENGADKDLRDHKGNTALIHAAIGDHVNILNYLIQQGANKNIKNFIGKTAADLAKDSCADILANEMPVNTRIAMLPSIRDYASRATTKKQEKIIAEINRFITVTSQDLNNNQENLVDMLIRCPLELDNEINLHLLALDGREYLLIAPFFIDSTLALGENSKNSPKIAGACPNSTVEALETGFLNDLLTKLTDDMAYLVKQLEEKKARTKISRRPH